MWSRLIELAYARTNWLLDLDTPAVPQTPEQVATIVVAIVCVELAQASDLRRGPCRRIHHFIMENQITSVRQVINNYGIMMDAYSRVPLDRRKIVKFCELLAAFANVDPLNMEQLSSMLATLI